RSRPAAGRSALQRLRPQGRPQMGHAPAWSGIAGGRRLQLRPQRVMFPPPTSRQDKESTMSFLSGLGDLVSNVVSLAVTAYTGNPMLGQLAGGLVGSLLGESGGSGNTAFDSVFNGAFSNGFLNAMGM